MTKPQVNRTLAMTIVLALIGYADSGVSGAFGMLCLTAAVIAYFFIMKAVEAMIGSSSGSWGDWDGDGDGGWDGDCGFD